MISMDSTGGRIGQFWWINSNTKISRFKDGLAPHVAMEGLQLIHWGTCGLGDRVTANFEATK